MILEINSDNRQEFTVCVAYDLNLCSEVGFCLTELVFFFYIKASSKSKTGKKINSTNDIKN